MRLSNHFTLKEFTRSAIATQNNLPNNPSSEQIQNLRLVAHSMEVIRAMAGNIPIIPDSVYRSPEVNQYVGGSSTSRHMAGLAIDFTIAGYTVKQVIDLIQMSNVPFHKCINEHDCWVHWSFPRLGEKAICQQWLKDSEGYHLIQV